MDSLEMIIAIIALLINLITILKFTNALEKRLTTLETIQNQVLKPQLDSINKRCEFIQNNTSRNREDFNKGN